MTGQYFGLMTLQMDGEWVGASVEVGRPVRRPWRSQEGRTGLSEVGGRETKKRGDT